MPGKTASWKLTPLGATRDRLRKSTAAYGYELQLVHPRLMADVAGVQSETMQTVVPAMKRLATLRTIGLKSDAERYRYFRPILDPVRSSYWKVQAIARVQFIPSAATRRSSVNIMPATMIDNRNAMRQSSPHAIDAIMLANSPTNGTRALTVFLRFGFGTSSRFRLSNCDGLEDLCRGCERFEDRLRLAIRGSFNGLELWLVIVDSHSFLKDQFLNSMSQSPKVQFLGHSSIKTSSDSLRTNQLFNFINPTNFQVDSRQITPFLVGLLLRSASEMSSRKNRRSRSRGNGRSIVCEASHQFRSTPETS